MTRFGWYRIARTVKSIALIYTRARVLQLAMGRDALISASLQTDWSSSIEARRMVALYFGYFDSGHICSRITVPIPLSDTRCFDLADSARSELLPQDSHCDARCFERTPLRLSRLSTLLE
jgi:hypothetical protein